MRFPFWKERNEFSVIIMECHAYIVVLDSCDLHIQGLQLILVHVFTAPLASLLLDALNNAAEIVGEELKEQVGAIGVDRIQLFFLLLQLSRLECCQVSWVQGLGVQLFYLMS